MRTIIYGITNKDTHKIIYTSGHRNDCINKLQELGEGYELRYKWRSF